MKSILLILSIAVAFTAGANADKKKQLSLSVLKKMKFTESAEAAGAAMFKPMFENLRAQGVPEAGVNQIKNAAENYLAKVYLDEGLIAELAQIYATTFTEEELEGLIAFYDTPIGQKLVETTPQITAQSVKVGQKYGVKYQAAFQAEVQQIIKDNPPLTEEPEIIE